MTQTQTTQKSFDSGPSLDTLNHTIEGLESRLGDILKIRQQSQFERKEQPDPAAARTGRVATPPPVSSGRIGTELREIGTALKELRSSLRADFTESLRGELTQLHRALSRLDRQRNDAAMQHDMRDELVRLAEGIRWLVVNTSADDNAPLMAEFQHLHGLLSRLADSQSVEKLEKRFDRLDSKIDRFDPERLDRELLALTGSLREIKQTLRARDDRDQFSDIEKRLTKLVAATETLAAHVPDASRKTDTHFAALEQKISDVDRQLEQLTQQQNQVAKGQAIQHVEERLGDLAGTLTAIDRQIRIQNDRQSQFGESLKSLASQIERHRQPDGYPQIEARLDKLASIIENAEHGVSAETFNSAITALSGKIDKIDLSAAERRITSGLEKTVSQQSVNELERKLNARLERLNALVENVGNQVEPEDLNKAVATITSQIGQLDIKASEHRLAAKFDKAASELSTGRLEKELRTRFNELNATVANIAPSIGPEALDGAVSRIADHIDRIDLQGTEQRITDRLDLIGLEKRLMSRLTALSDEARSDELHRKLATLDIEAVENRLTARIIALDTDGMEARLGQRIEAIATSPAFDPQLATRLERIAARLEASVTDSSSDAFEVLKTQIAELTSLVGRTGPSVSIGEIEQRIGAKIESLSATNDDYVIEAARYAAEEALKGLAQSRANAPAEAETTIIALISDLKALHEASQANDAIQRDGLAKTIETIAARLDSLSIPQTTARISDERPRPAPFRFEKDEALEGIETAGDGVSDDNAQADEMADVLSVLTRVRARQMGQDMPAPETHRNHDDPSRARKRNEPGLPAGVRNQLASKPGPQTDLIAAARRAAHSAASDVAAPSETDGGTGELRGSGSAHGNTASRRPIYLAVGAILLAVLAYPLANQIGGNGRPVLGPTPAVAATSPAIERKLPLGPEADMMTTGALVPDEAPRVVAVSAAPALPEKPDIAVTETKPAIPAFRITAADTGKQPADVIARVEAPARPTPPALAPVAAKAPERTQPARAMAPEQSEKISAPEVSALDVLDMLAETAPEKPRNEAAAPQPAAITKSEPSALEADDNRQLDMAIPDGIEPASLAAAARQGKRNALYEIGARLEDGTGMTADPGAASKWFAAAAERGLAPAAFRLGNLYEKGIGVGRDDRRAAAFYRQAAEAGNIGAMHNLAVMLANGSANGQPDLAEAAKWFESAAEHGMTDSQFNLAILYARGTGVAKDIAQSFKWFAIAARSGDTEAAKRSEAMAKSLSQEALYKARQAADMWQPKRPVLAANEVTLPNEWMTTAASAPVQPLNKTAVIRDLQDLLNSNGFDAGPADGVLGARTDAAIKAFQAANGFDANGEITPALVQALLASNKA